MQLRQVGQQAVSCGTDESPDVRGPPCGRHLQAPHHPWGKSCADVKVPCVVSPLLHSPIQSGLPTVVLRLGLVSVMTQGRATTSQVAKAETSRRKTWKTLLISCLYFILASSSAIT